MKKDIFSIIRRILAMVLIVVMVLDNNVVVMAESIIDAVEQKMEEAETQREYEQKVEAVASQVVPDEEQMVGESVAMDTENDEGEAIDAYNETDGTGENLQDEDTVRAEIEPDVSLRLPETLVGSSESVSDNEEVLGTLVAEDDYTKTYKKDATHYVTVLNSTKKTFTDEEGNEREYDLELVPTDKESGSELEQPSADEIRDQLAGAPISSEVERVLFCRHALALVYPESCPDVNLFSQSLSNIMPWLYIDFGEVIKQNSDSSEGE